MTAKDMTISTLTVTAVVLLTGLIILNVVTPQPAVASGQGGTLGHYIVTTGRLDEETELVYLFNTEAEVMLVYGFNVSTAAIELIQPIDIAPLLRPQRRPRR
jgi:hypothetical protein